MCSPRAVHPDLALAVSLSSDRGCPQPLAFLSLAVPSHACASSHLPAPLKIILEHGKAGHGEHGQGLRPGQGSAAVCPGLGYERLAATLPAAN